MPELPEVETTRRGISPHLLDQKIERLWVRESRLRWPVPEEAAVALAGQTVRSLSRRAKYLLMGTDRGHLLLHLGMSGSLCMVPAETRPAKHDHVDLVLANGTALRYTDPRRFGCLLWLTDDPMAHPLLSHLGPEPLEAGLTGAYLHHRAKGRKQAIKTFLMDHRIVAGVGNIYANEALFGAGILPTRPAGRISLARYEALVEQIRQVMNEALKAGGTTLRDFTGGDGKPGYFQQQLQVYGRGGQPCQQCDRPLQQRVIGQRATVFCKGCQS